MTAKQKIAKKVLKPTPPPVEPTAIEQRRPWYVALLLCGILLLGASTALAATGALSGLERHAFILVNHVNTPHWVAAQLAKPLSNAVWGMVGLVVLLLAVPKLRLRAWQYVVAGGSAYVLASIVEHFVDRARPAALAGYMVVLRANQGGPGFPSGHVAVITALGLTAWPYLSWPWRLLVATLIIAEAWSRVFLGVHAPLDVVGGVGAGAIVVAAIHLTPVRIRKIFKLSA